MLTWTSLPLVKQRWTNQILFTFLKSDKGHWMRIKVTTDRCHSEFGPPREVYIYIYLDIFDLLRKYKHKRDCFTFQFHFWILLDSFGCHIVRDRLLCHSNDTIALAVSRSSLRRRKFAGFSKDVGSSKKLRNVLDAFLSSLVEVLLKEQKYVGLLTLISCWFYQWVPVDWFLPETEVRIK